MLRFISPSQITNNHFCSVSFQDDRLTTGVFFLRASPQKLHFDVYLRVFSNAEDVVTTHLTIGCTSGRREWNLGNATHVVEGSLEV